MPVTITPSPGTAAIWGAMSKYPPTFEIIAIALSALALPFSAAFVTQLLDVQAMPKYLDASPSGPSNPSQVLYPGPATSKFAAQHVGQSLLPIALTLLVALGSFYAYSRRSLHPAVTLHNSAALAALSLLSTITTAHNATKHQGPEDEDLGRVIGFTAGPGIVATLCTIGICCNYFIYGIVSCVSWYRYRRYRKQSGNFNSAYASEYRSDASLREHGPEHGPEPSEWAGSWRAASASMHFDERCTECASRSTHRHKPPSRLDAESKKHSRGASASTKQIKSPSWSGNDSAKFMRTPSWFGSGSSKQAKTPSWVGSNSTRSHRPSAQRETFLSSQKSPAMSSRTGRSNLTSIGSDVMTGTALTAIPAVPSLSMLKPPASGKTSHEVAERKSETAGEKKVCSGGRASPSARVALSPPRVESQVSALTTDVDPARVSRSAVSAITMPTVIEAADSLPSNGSLSGLNITLVKPPSEGGRSERRKTSMG
ncbi:MAG: hypothetical protein Q9162_006839 [Coniocarpon cinnabarinum]